MSFDIFTAAAAAGRATTAGFATVDGDALATTSADNDDDGTAATTAGAATVDGDTLTTMSADDDDDDTAATTKGAEDDMALRWRAAVDVDTVLTTGAIDDMALTGAVDASALNGAVEVNVVADAGASFTGAVDTDDMALIGANDETALTRTATTVACAASKACAGDST